MNIHVVRTVAVLLFFVNSCRGLLCFNCSTSHCDWTQCAGDFVKSIYPFNSTKNNLVNCTGENSMCFVRSWSARARHAWIVQRGCYQPAADDTLLASMSIPTRAMTCRHERHPDAEYNVCLCQADWCNSASSTTPYTIHHLIKYLKATNHYIATLYGHMLHIFK